MRGCGDVVLMNVSIPDFLVELGSDSPAPGGGSASALAGALAGALVQMVARLSGEVHGDTAFKAEVLVQQFTHLAARDAEAFNQVIAAYRLPKTTVEEKEWRSTAVQQAVRLAAEVPLQIMEVSLEALALAQEMVLDGNKNAISDAGVAGVLASAACKGASYNVLINLPSLKDQKFCEVTKARLKEILDDAEQLEEDLTSILANRLGR